MLSGRGFLRVAPPCGTCPRSPGERAVVDDAGCLGRCRESAFFACGRAGCKWWAETNGRSPSRRYPKGLARHPGRVVRNADNAPCLAHRRRGLSVSSNDIRIDGVNLVQVDDRSANAETVLLCAYDSVKAHDRSACRPSCPKLWWPGQPRAGALDRPAHDSRHAVRKCCRR